MITNNWVLVSANGVGHDNCGSSISMLYTFAEKMPYGIIKIPFHKHEMLSLAIQ